jgi:hypothetical protein
MRQTPGPTSPLAHPPRTRNIRLDRRYYKLTTYGAERTCIGGLRHHAGQN